MEKQAKRLYEKMVDFKRYGILLLAVGAFFYLGVIIPSETKEMEDVFLMVGSSALFLSGSVLFFAFGKKARQQLMDMEEGEEFLAKK